MTPLTIPTRFPKECWLCGESEVPLRCDMYGPWWDLSIADRFICQGCFTPKDGEGTNGGAPCWDDLPTENEYREEA